MIPKVIHLNWFGKNDLPPNYHRNLDRWILLVSGTDWSIKIWTDESRELDLLRKPLEDSGAKPVQVSNIMRYLILYLYGGFYVDFDVIPLRLPQFDAQDKFNIFTEVTWDTATKDSTGKKKIAPNHAYMAAPPGDAYVRYGFWWLLQSTTFEPKTLEERYKGGIGMFKYMPKSWYDGVVLRGVNHFAPVNWAQARFFNICEHYTYDNWLELAESFLPYPEVYGVHTFDSSWVFQLNDEMLARRSKENEPDTSEGTEKSCGA